ncbi:MAG: hypothetical protein M5U34_20355 [Chloroflexi bacterium]|nr:hypothetical protein [Chloroflexota bacterium]
MKRKYPFWRNRRLTTLAEFAEAAVAIATRYETIVVLSLGEEGALAVNGETAVYLQPPPVQAKSVRWGRAIVWWPV